MDGRAIIVLIIAILGAVLTVWAVWPK